MIEHSAVEARGPLTDNELDELNHHVAAAEGIEIIEHEGGPRRVVKTGPNSLDERRWAYDPARERNTAMLLQEKYKLIVGPTGPGGSWVAHRLLSAIGGVGNSPCIAICRAVVELAVADGKILEKKRNG